MMKSVENINLSSKHLKGPKLSNLSKEILTINKNLHFLGKQESSSNPTDENPIFLSNVASFPSKVHQLRRRSKFSIFITKILYKINRFQTPEIANKRQSFRYQKVSFLYKESFT